MARMQTTGSMYGVGVGAFLVFALVGCRSSGGSGCCGRGMADDRAAVPSSLSLQAGATAATLPDTASPPTTRAYGGQKTCPVTGDDLGSMGPAIPVMVQGETVYVCCKGCSAKVQRDPDTYLAKVRAERAGP